MVTRLFTFIEATPLRYWILYVDALKDMKTDFASMDRISYSRLFTAYKADMNYLQNNPSQHLPVQS